jgi:hypothetical protein
VRLSPRGRPWSDRFIDLGIRAKQGDVATRRPERLRPPKPSRVARVDDRHWPRGSLDAPLSRTHVLALQRSAGNSAVAAILRPHEVIVQRQNGDDEQETPQERSRQSRPRNAPPGTRPIDESGLDRGTIHGIKDGIGAGPRDWVGISPDGHVITSDGEGNAEDHGHVSDYARSGSERIPTWVWVALGIVATIALIVLFATGVGEVAAIVAGLSELAAGIVMAALRLAGRLASADTDGAPSTGQPVAVASADTAASDSAAA